jgi:hypothetical protein
MQVVGVNSVDHRHVFEKYLREAMIPRFTLRAARMQRRRVHGVLAHPAFGATTLSRFTPSMNRPQRADATTTRGLAGPGRAWPVSDPWNALAPKPARVSMRSSSAAE